MRANSVQLNLGPKAAAAVYAFLRNRDAVEDAMNESSDSPYGLVDESDLQSLADSFDEENASYALEDDLKGEALPKVSRRERAQAAQARQADEEEADRVEYGRMGSSHRQPVCYSRTRYGQCPRWVEGGVGQRESELATRVSNRTGCSYFAALAALRGFRNSN